MTWVGQSAFLTALLLAVLVLLGTALLLLLKSRDYRSSSLSATAVEPQVREEWNRLVLPLGCYEDRYPTFVGILAASAATVPLHRLLETTNLAAPLGYLSHRGLVETEKSRVEFAMLEVVHALLSQPEVEFACRESLTAARLEQFLDELQSIPQTDPIRDRAGR